MLLFSDICCKLSKGCVILLDTACRSVALIVDNVFNASALFLFDSDWILLAVASVSLASASIFLIFAFDSAFAILVSFIILSASAFAFLSLHRLIVYFFDHLSIC